MADNCYIAVPSAFTPNGDGANNYLYPLNADKVSHLIFEKKPDRKWGGTVRGHPQSPVAYVWTLDYMGQRARKWH